MPRFLPLSDKNRAQMREIIGVQSVDDFFADVPPDAFLDSDIALPTHKSEREVENQMKQLARQNQSAEGQPFFCGAGAYRHHIPASVDYIIQRSEFMTSYTPYQPEIAQGTLQALFEFQSQVAILTQMDIANASMYDGSSSASEAVLMAHRINKRRKVILSKSLHPHYYQVIESLGALANIELHGAESLEDMLTALNENESHADGAHEGISSVVVQNPDFFGNICDFTALAQACHRQGALLIVIVNEVVSLGLLKPPGAFGADIVACEGQSLGNPLSFGGPYIGLLATRREFLRQMPGRICGRGVDSAGRDGYLLTLAAREQHIRREKATSNICTNAGLCALAFTIHLTLLGGEGLRRLALHNHFQAKKLSDACAEIDGVTIPNRHFFNEFTLESEKDADALIDAFLERQIMGGVSVKRLLPDDKSRQNQILVAVTEMNEDEELELYVKTLKDILR